MELLQYENLDVPAISYPGQIKSFIQKIRYYKTQRPHEELKAVMPELLQTDKDLKQLARDSGEPRHEFLEEIMDALLQEKELNERLVREVTKPARAILSRLYNARFAISDYAYTVRQAGEVSWVEFYGCRQATLTNAALTTVKEVFRSACYRLGMVFIDAENA